MSSATFNPTVAKLIEYSQENKTELKRPIRIMVLTARNSLFNFEFLRSFSLHIGTHRTQIGWWTGTLTCFIV